VHKTTHHDSASKPIASNRFTYPGAWNAVDIINSFNQHGFVIIKLKNEDHVKTMVDYQKATMNMFDFPENLKKKTLVLPKGYKPLPNAKTGYSIEKLQNHIEIVNFRSDEKMRDLYPDPTPLVPGYKQKFFKAYHLNGDITQKLIELVYSQVKNCHVLGYNRSDGCPKSVVRVLKYNRAGPAFSPHVDALYFSCSPRGTTPGLLIKNPITGHYSMPETDMHPSNELIVLPGMNLEESSRKLIKATVHAVTNLEPRLSFVFSVDVGVTRALTFGCDEEVDDEMFEGLFRDIVPRCVDP
jgi:hypothetical protein